MKTPRSSNGRSSPSPDIDTSMPKNCQEGLSEIAARIAATSKEAWGGQGVVEIFGRSPVMLAMLEKVEKFARFREPILIHGESGAGKELVARGCHALSPRLGKPFIEVNCPQYNDGNLVVSELFGHVKGSFTGAIRDHRGHFETADGGSIFLDEVADLHMAAQTMLLRALAQNEFKPLGSEKTLRSNIRVISATNRPLREMIHSGEFREDLFFRLRYFPLEVPPLRDRGNDWKYIACYLLARLANEYGVCKKFSEDAVRLLSTYQWPGNVRELRSIVTVGYCMAEGGIIEPCHIHDAMRRDEPKEKLTPSYVRLYEKMVKENGSFWDELYMQFMMRDINRREARAVIRRGLIETRNSYQGLLKLFNMKPEDYQRFMDFLRHHRLKPGDE